MEFTPGTLTENLRRYFAASEQVATALDVRVLPLDREPLGAVAGIVVQKMPDGSPEALEEVRRRIAAGAFREALAGGATGEDLARAVVGAGLEVLARGEVGYVCNCDRQRAGTRSPPWAPTASARSWPRRSRWSSTASSARSATWSTSPELLDIARRLEGGIPGGAKA